MPKTHSCGLRSDGHPEIGLISRIDLNIFAMCSVSDCKGVKQMNHGLTFQGCLFLSKKGQDWSYRATQTGHWSPGWWAPYPRETIFASHGHCLEKMLHMLQLDFGDRFRANSGQWMWLWNQLLHLLFTVWLVLCGCKEVCMYYLTKQWGGYYCSLIWLIIETEVWRKAWVTCLRLHGS